jgi:phosphohistidine phosphatase
VKRLYLIRHAKSSWDDPRLADFDRPLNDRGKRDAPRMGRRLAEAGHRPDLLLSSPAKRAFGTAKRVARELGFRKGDIFRNIRLYHADESQLLQAVQAQPDAAGSLMLFGHNPGLTEFATLLCRYPFGNVPTCGVVCIDFPVDSWKRVAYHQGALQFFDYPRKHDAKGSQP